MTLDGLDMEAVSHLPARRGRTSTEVPFKGGSFRQDARVSTAAQPPNQADVEGRFAAVLDHSQSREDVDRWAAQWVNIAPGTLDPAVRWGLEILVLLESRHGPGAPYLYDDDQIAAWLTEYRSRCSKHS